MDLVVHPFAHLLAGISGEVQLMQMRLLQGRHTDFERYITTAMGASRRAAALTHQLPAFLRQQTLTPKPTDVNRLAADMQDLVQRTAGPARPADPGRRPEWQQMADAGRVFRPGLQVLFSRPGPGMAVPTKLFSMDDMARRIGSMSAAERSAPPAADDAGQAIWMGSTANFYCGAGEVGGCRDAVSASG